MAKYGVTNIAGGGGVGSDEISVTKEYVLSGKTYVGSDTYDEIGIGTMANNGATGNQSLNAGGSFSVKKGYHAQDFTVNSNNLASQTPGNATPSHVLNGELYWTNGNKLTGTMSVQSILSFSCAPYSASQLIFTWQNPSIGPYSGVIIIGKTGGYPANINDGTRYYKGFGNNTYGGGASNAVIGGWSSGITYYFRAFSYATINNGEWVSGYSLISKTIINIITKVITTSQTWIVPTNINSVQVFLVGGGGSGGRAEGGGGGDGGSGGRTITSTLAVTPNENISIIIGSGGVNGGNGGNTSFKTIVANGGSSYAGFGGSGGGKGGDLALGDKTTGRGGNGGTNGGNGDSWRSSSPQNGQGYTTTAFQENTGTLYSAGGGGGSGLNVGRSYFGIGGQYGAGNGGYFNLSSTKKTATDATSNSGSGGGGSGLRENNDEDYVSTPPGNGGSGICIIRYIS